MRGRVNPQTSVLRSPEHADHSGDDTCRSPKIGGCHLTSLWAVLELAATEMEVRWSTPWLTSWELSDSDARAI